MTASREVVLEAIKGWRCERAGPLVIGLCGAQGSGKSTLAAQLKDRLEGDGIRTAILSLDDLYLSHSARADLADRIHPLFQTRGVPGTHDVALGELILAGLTKPCPHHLWGEGTAEGGGRGMSSGATVSLPRFEKATDNPLPPQAWPIVTAPVDVVIFEGWCVGARPQPALDLIEPINALEHDHDTDATWRTYANNQLAGPYQSLFASIDRLILLAAPSFTNVYTWRLEQEQQLAARLATDRLVGMYVMMDAQVADFIQYYQRLTQHILAAMPSYADLTLQLDADRNLIETLVK